MTRYACRAHNRIAATCPLACPECYAEQERRMQLPRSQRGELLFRKVEGSEFAPAAPTRASPWTKPLPAGPSPAYVAELPPAAVEASRELAEALAAHGLAPKGEPAPCTSTPGCAGHIVMHTLPGGGGAMLCAVCRQAPGVREIDTTVHEVPARPPVVEVAPPDGPRFAGIDPGERWVAVVVGVETPEWPRVVASETFEIGHGEPWASATRRDGTPHRTPTRHVIGDDDMGPFLAAIVTFLIRHKVDRVTIEMAKLFHAAPGASDGARGGQAALLLRSQRVAAAIEGCLRAFAGLAAAGQPVGRPMEIRTCSSAEWRAAACARAKLPRPAPGPDGKRPRRPKEDGLRAVRALWGGSLPPGEHVVDAAGAALWDGVPPKVERAPRPRAPRPSSKPLRSASAIVEAIRAHGRPIRVDVLAVRLAVAPGALRPHLRRALAAGLVTQPARGIYALP